MRGSLARVLLVAIAFGCADSGAGISAAVVSSAPTARCSTRQLRVHYDYAFELMAQVTVVLAYTNNSTHRCTLSGWPRVKAISDARPAVAGVRTGAMWWFANPHRRARQPDR